MYECRCVCVGGGACACVYTCVRAYQCACHVTQSPKTSGPIKIKFGNHIVKRCQSLKFVYTCDARVRGRHNILYKICLNNVLKVLNTKQTLFDINILSMAVYLLRKHYPTAVLGSYLKLYFVAMRSFIVGFENKIF